MSENHRVLATIDLRDHPTIAYCDSMAWGYLPDRIQERERYTAVRGVPSLAKNQLHSMHSPAPNGMGSCVHAILQKLSFAEVQQCLRNCACGVCRCHCPRSSVFQEADWSQVWSFGLPFPTGSNKMLQVFALSPHTMVRAGDRPYLVAARHSPQRSKFPTASTTCNRLNFEAAIFCVWQQANTCTGSNFEAATFCIW